MDSVTQDNDNRGILLKEIDKHLGWALIILIVILPLLVYYKEFYFISPRIISPIVDTGIKKELFTYYKWLLLIGITLYCSFFLFYKTIAYKYTLRKSYINIPLLFLALLIVLSLWATEYTGISLVGLYNQRCGTVTYLCYLSLLFVSANITFEKNFSRYITYALGSFVIINLVIILFNFLGHDLWQYELFKSLILPSSVDSESLKGTIWSTFENPNYVSGFSSALAAYFLTLALLETRGNKCTVYILMAAASFAIVLASLSSSGFVSLIVISPIIIILIFLNRRKRQTLLAAGVSLILFIVIFSFMNSYNQGVFDQTVGFIKQTAGIGSMTAQPILSDSKQVSNSFNLPEPHSSAGSGRGYIWSETIKLIKVRPITGYGLDTLTFYFPQNDINKIAGLGSYNTLITKPHNMYLSIAYGSGIPALIVILALFLMHFFYSARYLLKSKFTETIIFPAALFLFFCTFAVQWLFNDAIIGSSAVFWVLLGVGVNINTSYKSIE